LQNADFQPIGSDILLVVQANNVHVVNCSML